ncbi:hypothetical protein [Roseivirga sp. E12]|nr:hypothetical protein [Roseivirga sp. E12]MBO3697708.1 hypothetical protein [Roseivirga sp. E12]
MKSSIELDDCHNENFSALNEQLRFEEIKEISAWQKKTTIGLFLLF